jgi:hypothetical protein
MAFDLARRQTVMFGGAKDGTVNGGLNDTWTWNGLDWTQQNPATVPPTRTWAPASFDLARGVVVMFGGRIHGGPVGPSGVQNDTWEWNGTDWTQITTTNQPAARYGGTMAYDVARGVHVLFSGVNGSNVSFNDTWEYNGTTRTWTQIQTANSPGGRVYAGMAYDQSRRRIVVYGGADDSFVIRPSIFWEYDGVDWRQVTPATTPGPVQGHVMVYDTARRRVVMQGGETTGRAKRIGTWEYDGTHCYAFTSEATPAPGNWLAAGACDLVRQRMLVFGGYNATNQRTAVSWERDPNRPGFATFGLGCPGAGAQLSARTLPALGTTFTLDAIGLPVSGLVSVLLGTSNLTWGALPLPLDLGLIGLPGCSLYTSVELATGVPNNAGTATWSVPIPNDPSLRGLTFFDQVLVNAAGALSLSNASSAHVW